MARHVLTPADNPKPFRPGNNANPKGRPPKLTSLILKEWKAAGYERVTKSMVEEVYEHLIGLSQEQLKEMAADPSQPALVSIAAKRMVSAKGFEALETLLSRSQGQAAQPIDFEHVKDPSAVQSILTALGLVRTPRSGAAREE